ncbi:MAG: hypothetical protein L0Z48_03955 [candidate division Zixibacteria bacterium]|nr:hypothetical protein [candidate division Zixibacteria bacterium]
MDNLHLKFKRRHGRSEQTTVLRRADRTAGALKDENGATVSKGNGSSSSTAGVSAIFSEKRFVIQDYRPLAESLDWELGQLFWQKHGSRGFLDGSIPFKLTNDGTLSARAAEIFFTGLEASEKEGSSDSKIYALELGCGTGLFARYFLDAFRSLCRRRGRNFYGRFCYVAADRSRPMLEDLKRNEILSSHEGHYRIQWADALLPQFGLNPAASGSGRRHEPFRAIFFNYLLDNLPAAVLKVEQKAISQLCIETALAEGVDLQKHTRLDAAELARLAASSDFSEKSEMLELYPLFALRGEYRPAKAGDLPYVSFAVSQAPANGGCLLHSYGAIRCLEEALTFLPEGGFILFNDYADTPFDDALQGYRHQRFGGSTAIGLNLALLKSYFGNRPACQWVEPDEADRRICSRLLGHRLPSATIERFRKAFSPAALEQPYAWMETARQRAAEGNLQAALAAYHEALAHQPANWALMAEIADFLTFKEGNYPAGLRMANAGLEQNPISPELWNTHGDCLFYLERMDEAHTAFLRALQLNPGDVRARYNLGFTFGRRNEPAEALRVIAEGLALDKNGEYRDRLLQKQAEILGEMQKRHEQESRWLATRFGRRVEVPEAG